MTGGNEPGGLRLFKPGELAKLEPRRFVIGGVLPCGDAMLLHGPPIGGKSALAVAAACSVGTGTDFFGHKVRRGLVVYILAERVRETDRRLQAALAGSPGDHAIRLVRARLFGQRADICGLIEAIKAAEVETGQRAALLIFDTVVSLLRDGGGDENSQRDMSRLTEAIDALRSATGAAAIVIHHSKRGEHRPKGSEVLEAWAETVASIRAIPKSGDQRLAIERSNTTEPGVKARFTLKPVDLGQDPETGDRSQVIVAVSVETPETSGKPRPIRLAPDVEVAFTELKKLDEPIALDDWRSSVMVAFAEKPTQAARRVAFFNARRKLEDEGFIHIEGETVSIRSALV